MLAPLELLAAQEDIIWTPETHFLKVEWQYAHTFAGCRLQQDGPQCIPCYGVMSSDQARHAQRAGALCSKYMLSPS